MRIFWVIGPIAVILILALALGGKNRSPRHVNHHGMYAIDGDTVYLDGRTYDIAGIDAPELGQFCLDGEQMDACGEHAAFTLNKFIFFDPPDCQPADWQGGAYQCISPVEDVAIHQLENGEAIVLSGAALTYQDMAQKAQGEKFGIWRGQFVPPAEWRAGTRLPGQSADAQKCPVLVVGQDGQDYYITPTHPDYDGFKRLATDSTQRYCSDEAARADGLEWLPLK